jgi:hypothetical protein
MWGSLSDERTGGYILMFAIVTMLNLGFLYTGEELHHCNTGTCNFPLSVQFYNDYNPSENGVTTLSLAEPR